MRIFKQLVCCLLASSIAIAAVNAKSCSQNYECGVQPFAYCYNMTAKQMLPGIGLDSGHHSIVFINKLGTVNGGQPDRVSFLGSVSMDGGQFEPIQEIESDANVQNGQNVIQLYNYLESKSIPYIVNAKATAGNAGVGPYANGVFTQVWGVLSVYLGMAFDEKNNIMYSCDLSIRKYNKIPMTPSDRLDNVTMYQDQTCNAMDFYNGNLYFVGGSNFYKADLSCVNCDKSKLTPLFTESSYVHAMAASDSDIFFTSSTGIYKVSIADPNSKVQISSETEAGDIIYSQGHIYYQTQSQIKSVEISTGKTSVIYDANASVAANQCMCATGFKGDQCETCSGTTQWNNGVPKCYNENQPLFCVQDYECGNVPFTLCNYGSCQCRDNFYGTKCDKCDGSITWDLGKPVCTKA